jgi:hypothetical protein
MSDKKIGCVFLQISNYEGDNYQEDDFFAPNAINSFKKWHPNVDIHHITNSNFKSYLEELNITEYYDAVGLIRIYIIKELLRQKGYDKIIMLGLDTFTCSYLDEFIDNDKDNLICSSGPPYEFIRTEHWSPKIVEFEHNGGFYRDIDFINADVACFNNWEIADMLINKSIEFWSDHSEQGGMNYLYQNQKSLDIKVSIVDFPYIKTELLYNVRSKGSACGGNQMYRGKLYSGNYKDPNSRIIEDIYPTSTYYVNKNKLFTSDNKQIKVFHYAEALGVKSKEEYNEILNEIKTLWFNQETIEFLTNQCRCKF